MMQGRHARTHERLARLIEHAAGNRAAATEKQIPLERLAVRQFESRRRRHRGPVCAKETGFHRLDLIFPGVKSFKGVATLLIGHGLRRRRSDLAADRLQEDARIGNGRAFV